MKQRDYTGEILDERYEILAHLDAGGMGAVYLGQHIALRKKVAVKFLHSDYVGEPHVVKRFFREAQTAAAVRHKNIIEVLDVDVASTGEPYIVMEYLEGESLAAMLKRRGPLSLRESCCIMAPLLSALSAAHARDIVHRDLKPENIFIADIPGDEPVLKLIDFGISKFTSANQEVLTRTDAILGTPAFMSPEQICESKSVDHRADLYSVGVILYKMLTGQYPFRGKTYEGMLCSIMSNEPTPPKEVYDGFPAEVEPLLLRILSRDPDARPQSAEVLWKELERLAIYQERPPHLSDLTAGATQRSVAGGDLGSGMPKDVAPVAGELFAEIKKRPRGKGLVGRIVPNGGDSLRFRLLLGITPLLIAGVAAVFLIQRGSAPAEVTIGKRIDAVGVSSIPPKRTVEHSEPVVSVAPISEISEGAGSMVTLQITGAPEDAVITFDGVVYDAPRFEVERSQDERLLRVTAFGYSPFEDEIVVDGNLALAVALDKKPQTEKKETRKQEALHSKPKQARKSKTETGRIHQEEETPSLPAVGVRSRDTKVDLTRFEKVWQR